MLIEFYGVTQEITGEESIRLSSIKDISSLKEWLFNEYPAIIDIPLIFAVNNEIINNNTLLKKTDKIAVMPPFSGG